MGYAKDLFMYERELSLDDEYYPTPQEREKFTSLTLRGNPLATKEEIREAAKAVAESISDPVEAYIQLKRIQMLATEIQNELKPGLLQAWEEDTETLGAEMKATGGVRWSFDHDEEIQELKEKIKARESLMKSAAMNPTEPIFDSDGVQIPPAERNPISPSFKVTIK